MRFNSINLKAFGCFTDHEINFPKENNVHIIYGNNEAGKSTVLRAIIDLLYGMPHRSQDSFLHDKLRIEGCISAAGGNELSFARRKGNKNTLLDSDNNPLSDTTLQQFLNNIDKSAFMAMFGMDHRRLREGGESILKGGGVVGETLFEAAAGISYIRDLFREIDNEANSLYKKTASKPPINTKIKEYKEAKKTINELSMAPSQWTEQEKRYEEEKIKLEQLIDKNKALQKDKVKLERIKRVLPLLSVRKEHVEELEGLGDIPLLRDTFRDERLNLIAEQEKAKAEERKLERDIQELKSRAATIIIPKGLLEKLPDVSDLHEKLDAYRNCINDLPERRDESRMLEQEAMALLKEINPLMHSLDEADKLSLSFDQKEEIRRLIAEDRYQRDEMTKVTERIKTFEQSLNKNKQEREKMGDFRDPSSLSRAVIQAQKLGAPESTLQKNRLQAESLRKSMLNNLDTLGLWRGSVEEFQKLSLPLAETVKVYDERFGKMQEKIKDAEREVKGCKDNIAETKKKIENIESGGEVPTEEKLWDERKRRNHGWNLVKRAWLQSERNAEEETAFDSENTLETAYEKSVLQTDEVADLLYKDANLVATKTTYLKDLKAYEEKLITFLKEKDDLEEQKESLSNEWEKAWEEVMILPLSPREMLSWLERCREIKEQIETLDETEKETRMLEELILKHRSEINGALKNLGEKQEEDETLDKLVDRAQKLAKGIEKSSNNINLNEQTREQIQSDLSLAETDKKQVEEKITLWKKSWSESMKLINLSGEANTGIADIFLKKTDDLFSKIRELNNINIRIEEIKKYQQEFESKAAVVMKEAASDLAELPCNLAVYSLYKRVEKAGNDKVSLEEIENQIKKLQKDLKEAQRAYENADLRLKELIKEVGCKDISELEEVEQKFDRLRDLKNKITELEARLIEVGEGVSLDEIYREAQHADRDIVEVDIQELEHQLDLLDGERSVLEQEFGAIKKDYKEKQRGNSIAAVEAAETAQSLLAELSTDTERYIRLRLASAVLRRGIENYRQENQDPILKRAAQLFSSLTLGSFSGLRVDYDDNDNAVLVGIRHSECSGVHVNGMSDGTQDQLYLSLRLAFLEKYCQDTEPMPLILDDILINFDDRRSEETLKLLGDMSSKTQILFFTHHDKLVNLARKNIPEYKLNIHKLSRPE